MPNVSNYAVNNFLIDKLLRAGTVTIPATMYCALFEGVGAWTASTAYTVGQYIVPTTSNGRLYKCTTAGTSSSTQPSWGTTNGGTTTDGTVTWTEQTTALLASTMPTEANYTGYTRVAVAAGAGASGWAATNAPGSTVTPSTGTSGQSSNNGVITFGAPTSSQAGQIVLAAFYDASTGGDMIYWAVLTAPKTINNGDAAPSFPAGAFTIQYQ